MLRRKREALARSEAPDVRRELQTEMQQNFGEFVSGDVAGACGLPRYVFRPLDEIIVGETTISIEGETTAPKRPAGR